MSPESCPLIAGKTLAEERQICLNCPFPRCILEIPDVHPAKELRNMQIRELAAEGKTVSELQETFAIGKRTTQRALHVGKRFYDS